MINIHLSQATSPRGFHYAPDPSSQMACTIGGNIAENSGGPHCLKYGMTTNHVLAVEVILPSGGLSRLAEAGSTRRAMICWVCLSVRKAPLGLQQRRR